MPTLTPAIFLSARYLELLAGAMRALGCPSLVLAGKKTFGDFLNALKDQLRDRGLRRELAAIVEEELHMVPSKACEMCGAEMAASDICDDFKVQPIRSLSCCDGKRLHLCPACALEHIDHVHRLPPLSPL